MKTKKRKAKFLFSLKLLCMLLIILAFSSVFIYQYNGYLTLVQKEKDIKIDLQKEKDIEQQLLTEKTLKNSDASIEKRARTELNMLKQNEIKVIVNEK